VLHGALPTFIAASTPLFLRTQMGVDPVLTPTTYAMATFCSQACELAVRLPVETVLRRGQLDYVSSPPPPSTKSAQKSARGRHAQTPQGSSTSGLKESESLETVVPVGPYKGLLGTAYHIVFEEGQRGDSAVIAAKEGLARSTGQSGGVVRSQQQAQAQQRKKKGQGVEGLYRGWRVGVWGLVGVWGAAVLGGSGGKGGEF